MTVESVDAPERASLPKGMDCSWCDGTGKALLNLAHRDQWRWYSICSGHHPSHADENCPRCQVGCWRIVAPES